MPFKRLLYPLAALTVILWAGLPFQAQSRAGNFPQKKACSSLWPVELEKKWGYIDKSGRLIIPCNFDGAGDFSEGLAAVEIHGKCGYIDETGNFAIPPRFYGGRPFSEGMALVILGQSEGRNGRPNIFKFGYIDRAGKVLIQAQEALSAKELSYLYKSLAFSEGLACVTQNDKIGFLDKAGKQVIPPSYDEALPFSEGLAAVKIAGKFGYIDRSGKMVIPARFDDAGPFAEGLAYIETAGNCGYIDKSGKVAIKGEEFLGGRDFSQGLAAVRGKNDRYGYINKTGKFVIPPSYRRVGDFSEGLAAVTPADAKWPGNLAYINQKGQVAIKAMSTIPDRPDKVEFGLRYYRFCGGVARVSLGKKEDADAAGYINREGKVIWPPAAPAKKSK